MGKPPTTGRRPFHRRFHADAIMGTRDLLLEERGAYYDLLDLMYDKGRPIPDEPRYLAGFMGISVRKWNTIRDSLLASGKIIIRGEYLSNARFERELELEQQETQAAVAWGQKGGKTRAANERKLREQAARAKQSSLPLSVEIRAIPPVEGKGALDMGLTPVSTVADDDPDVSASFHDVFADFSASFHETYLSETDKKAQKTADETQGNLKPARATIFQSPERERLTSLSPRDPDPPTKPSRAKAVNATKLLPSWTPEPLSEGVDELVSRWPEEALPLELAKFRDHAKTNGRTAKDWDAAFRNWLRKADEKHGRDSARNPGKPSGWGFATGR